MKKTYIKPTMFVVEIKQRSHLLQASKVVELTDNAGLGLGGSDEGVGEIVLRGRAASFDDEWFEE